MTSNALAQQITTGQQIRLLSEDVKDVGIKLQKIQSLASNTLQDSTDAYDQALQIYRQALSLEVPSVNSGDLKAQADKVIAEAVRIADEAQRLMDSNQQLLQETQDRRVNLEEDLLARAKLQQQPVDAQSADMKSNKQRALNAVSDGNAVLGEAQETLKTLEGELPSRSKS